jgi:hypothetical protein
MKDFHEFISTDHAGLTEAKEYILWAVPKGETDQLHAQPIYTQGRSPQDVERVKALAAKEGWHSFRMQVLDLSQPFDAPKAFAKAVRPDAADRVLRSKRGRRIGEAADDISEADKASRSGTKAKVGTGAKAAFSDGGTVHIIADDGGKGDGRRRNGWFVVHYSKDGAVDQWHFDDLTAAQEKARSVADRSQARLKF